MAEDTGIQRLRDAAMEHAWDQVETEELLPYLPPSRVDPGEWMGDVAVVVTEREDHPDGWPLTVAATFEATVQPVGHAPFVIWTRRYSLAGPGDTPEWEEV